MIEMHFVVRNSFYYIIRPYKYMLNGNPVVIILVLFAGICNGSVWLMVWLAFLNKINDLFKLDSITFTSMKPKLCCNGLTFHNH